MLVLFGKVNASVWVVEILCHFLNFIIQIPFYYMTSFVFVAFFIEIFHNELKINKLKKST